VSVRVVLRSDGREVSPDEGTVDAAPIVPGDRFMAVAEAITGAYFVVMHVDAERVSLAACTARVDGVLHVHPRVERLRDTSVWRRL
jgi:hypothetical protein